MARRRLPPTIGLPVMGLALTGYGLLATLWAGAHPNTKHPWYWGTWWLLFPTACFVVALLLMVLPAIPRRRGPVPAQVSQPAGPSSTQGASPLERDARQLATEIFGSLGYGPSGEQIIDVHTLGIRLSLLHSAGYGRRFADQFGGRLDAVREELALEGLASARTNLRDPLSPTDAQEVARHLREYAGMLAQLRSQ